MADVADAVEPSDMTVTIDKDEYVFKKPEADHFPHQAALVEHMVAAMPSLLVQNGYDSVIACFVYWKETDRPHVKTSAKDLKELFEQQYNFQVHEIELPSNKKAAAKFNHFLTQNVLALQEDPGENKLFILYYCGHAKLQQKRGESVWKGVWYPQDFPENEKVMSRPSIEPANMIEAALPDVDFLALFDCCSAAGVLNHYDEDQETPWNERCEVLAAAGVTEKADGGRANFTEALIELLEMDSSLTDGIKAASLYNRLKSKDYIKATKLAATPHYDRHNPRIQSSILIRPLRREEEPPSSRQSTDSVVSTLVNGLAAETDAQVLVAVRFLDPAEAPLVQEWEEWMRNRPTNIKNIAFYQTVWDYLKCHCIFKADSGLAVCSVPLWLWTALLPTRAMNYIGIIRSDNLLKPRLVDVASAETQTKFTPPLDMDVSKGSQEYQIGQKPLSGKAQPTQEMETSPITHADVSLELLDEPTQPERALEDHVTQRPDWIHVSASSFSLRTLSSSYIPLSTASRSSQRERDHPGSVMLHGIRNTVNGFLAGLKLTAAGGRGTPDGLRFTAASLTGPMNEDPKLAAMLYGIDKKRRRHKLDASAVDFKSFGPFVRPRATVKGVVPVSIRVSPQSKGPWASSGRGPVGFSEVQRGCTRVHGI